MPESLPVVSPEQLKAWASLSYPQLVHQLLRLCVDPQEMSDQELKGVMEGCYANFDNPDEVVSCAHVGPLVFAELWHGPTGAFKDLSLVVLARVVRHFLRRRGQRSVVLVSTSGDTGSAAIHSVLGMEKDVQLLVMYPRHMVSRTQELQMTTVQAPNVRVFSVDGTSDDTDVVMATLFAEKDFARKHNLNVFNSLNICRVLVQMVHFFYLYLQLCPEADQDVLFCVPTGGLGNISSGMLAREMGLPVKFLAAVNENDCVFQTLRSGVYKVPSTVHKTVSCAMDISVPYNMERILYCLSGGNVALVRETMQEFMRNKSCLFPGSVMDANTCISSASVPEGVVLATMREVWQQHGYLICPHTAVATRAALDLLKDREQGAGKEEEEEDSVKTASPLALKPVVICTATPAKFAEAAERAGLPLPPSPRFNNLGGLEEHKLYMNKGEDWVKIMKQEIEKMWTIGSTA